ALVSGKVAASVVMAVLQIRLGTSASTDPAPPGKESLGPPARCDSSAAAGWSSWAERKPMEVVMRKVIQSVLVSADGVVSDPGQWALDYRDAGVEKDTLHRLGDIGSMLLGRGTYQLFAATWPGQTSDFAARMNSMRKYV